MKTPKPRLLVVTKDIAGGRMAARVVSAIVKDNSDVLVRIVAEGKSPDVWVKAGFKPNWTFSENMEEARATCQTKEIVSSYRPDLIIVSIGSPVNLERDFLVVGKQLGVPVVMLEDFHRSHVRFPERPDLLVVLDDYAAELAKVTWPAVETITSGSSSIFESEVDVEVKHQVERLQSCHGRVVMFSGASTFDDLALSVEIMQKNEGCLVPRFHPKLLDQVPNSDYTNLSVEEINGRNNLQIWEDLLKPLGDRVERIGHDGDGLTDQIAAVADVTLSGFSSVLQTAVHRDRLAVSLDTPEVRKSLEFQTGLTGVPMVGLGVVHKVSEPIDLGELRPLPHESLKPFDSDLVAARISDLVS